MGKLLQAGHPPGDELFSMSVEDVEVARDQNVLAGSFAGEDHLPCKCYLQKI